jgi:hypothetical protein
MTPSSSPNLYRRFQRLLRTPPLLVGDVLANDAGTATIELPGGGRIQARGDAQQGARVFVRGGVIEGEAPALPIEIIEV